MDLDSLAPPVMKGKMMKRGSLFPTWTERFFVLERGRLTYFEPEHWFELGDRDLTGFEIVYSPTHKEVNKIVLRHPQKRSRFVLRTFKPKERDTWISCLHAHIIFANLISDDPDMALKLSCALRRPKDYKSGKNKRNPEESNDCSDEMSPEQPNTSTKALPEKDSPSSKKSLDANSPRDVTVADLSSKQTRMTTISPANSTINLEKFLSSKTIDTAVGDELVPPPPPMKGWMTKRGQRLKSWRERYFVLEEGRLSYFRIKASDGTGMYEWTKLGDIYLAGYTVKRENVTGVTVSHDHEIRGPGHLILKQADDSMFATTLKELIMVTQMESDWLVWSSALTSHIAYADALTRHLPKETLLWTFPIISAFRRRMSAGNCVSGGEGAGESGGDGSAIDGDSRQSLSSHPLSAPTTPTDTANESESHLRLSGDPLAPDDTKSVPQAPSPSGIRPFSHKGYTYVGEKIIVEVFENERRGMMGGWSAKNLFVHPQYSDATGRFMTSSLADVPLPPGCMWGDDDWVVDPTHTQTDEDGWSYAIAYEYLISNCQRGTSVAQPNMSQNSRRRRWIRSATIAIDGMGRGKIASVDGATTALATTQEEDDDDDDDDDECDDEGGDSFLTTRTASAYLENIYGWDGDLEMRDFECSALRGPQFEEVLRQWKERAGAVRQVCSEIRQQSTGDP